MITKLVMQSTKWLPEKVFFVVHVGEILPHMIEDVFTVGDVMSQQ